MDEVARRMSVQHPIKRQQTPQGLIYIREVEFDVIVEPWARYQVKDAGQVRLRSTANKMYEVLNPDQNAGLDENGWPKGFVNALNEDGDKMYFVNSALVIVGSAGA